MPFASRSRTAKRSKQGGLIQHRYRGEYLCSGQAGGDLDAGLLEQQAVGTDREAARAITRGRRARDLRCSFSGVWRDSKASRALRRSLGRIFAINTRRQTDKRRC